MAEQDYVSMLNLQADTEELLNYNPEADANASIPPFPAGTYPCMVSFAEADPEKIWRVKIAKDGQKMYMTTVTLELYSTPEGKYDGRTIQHFVTTYTSQFSGTNAVQGLLQGLGMGEHVRAIGKQRGPLVTALNDALMGGGATAEGVFDWEARYSIENPPESGIWEEKFKKVGMKRFKQLDDGSYDPLADYNGIPVMARNVLLRFVNPEKAQQKAAVGTAPRPVAATAAPQPTQSASPRPPQAASAPQPAQPATNAPSGPPVPPRVRQGAPRAAGAPPVPVR